MSMSGNALGGRWFSGVRAARLGRQSGRGLAGHAFVRAVFPALLAGWWGVGVAQVAITEGGQTSYGQAIPVPPGVAGMAPQLGLYYSGGGVNGPVGYGWSVQGLSAVMRCPATMAIDGKRSGVSYSGSDKLCLDAQRLIQTDESGNPKATANSVNVPVATQANDAQGLSAGYREFRTEKDTYARIRAYGYASGDTTGSSGPQYFKVWTKSGQIYEYGASPSADMNTKALITAQGKTAAMAWAVARISDTLGNHIDFKYEQRDVAWGSGPTAGSPTLGHEWNLQEVQYSGNKVIFSYADRTAGSPQDAAETYHQGSKNVSVRLLQSVTTYVNAADTANLGAGAGVAVKTVKLSYDRGSISGRSRVIKIQECAGDAGSTRCLPGASFSYADGGNDAYQATTAFNLQTLTMQSLSGNYGVLTGDFNADGKTDLIRWSDTPAENRLYLSNGDGSFAQSTAFNITDENLFKSDGCYFSMLGDFDGDGRTDILRYATNLTPAWTSCANPGVTYLYVGNGDGSFVRNTITGVTLERLSSLLTKGCSDGSTPRNGFCANLDPPDTFGWTRGSIFYLLDVDGDSKLDVITASLPAQSAYVTHTDPCASTTCTRVFRGDGQGAFAEITSTNVANKLLFTNPDAGYTLGQPTKVVDVDGDGLADINGVYNLYMQLVTGGPATAWRSRGDGNFDSASYISACTNPIDLNGDGRTDCLGANATSPANNTLSVANGTATPQIVANFNLKSSGQELGGTGAGFVVVDMNGDGRHDILRWKDDVSQNAVYLSNGDGTFKASSTFNLYVPLRKSDGTSDFIVGDFTGRGSVEILRLMSGAATATVSTAQNQLYVKFNQAPLDQLDTATAPSGAKMKLYYVPLSNATPANGVSGSYGSRYSSDRGTVNAAVVPSVDLNLPMPVVVTSVTDSGVGSATVQTEYSYAGLKADANGRGMLGFREVRRQGPGPNGQNLTAVTRYLQSQPYIGVISRSDTYLGDLNSTASAAVLSSTGNVYCDASASASQIDAATPSAPCPAATQPQRPYLLRTTETGTDLQGVTLPQVVTQNSFNTSGDPTQIAVTTTGQAASISQTFTKTTVNQYRADDTACSNNQTCNWILGRLSRASVTSSVPNSLPRIATSAGTSTYASATSGSGPVQVAVLTPALAFGDVAVGSSATLVVTLANSGAAALGITAPSASSISGSDFSLVSTTCGSTLAPGASCTVSLKFSPSAKTTRSGSFSLATGAGTLNASLTGTGLQGTASLSATSVSFAATQVGSTSATQSFTLSNNGTYALSVSTATSSTSDYTATHNCSNVVVGGNCTVSVNFTPGAAGSRSATLTLTGSASNSPNTISLSGTGQAQSATLGAINFGGVAVGASSTLTATLANTGIGPLSLTAPSTSAVGGTDFSFVSTTCASSLTVGANCTVIVRFSPTAAASRSGSLSLSTGAGTLSAILSGIGNGSVATLTSASTLAVPGAWYGSAAQTVTATYRNDGNTVLSLAMPVLTAPLSVSSNNCSSIAVGASCSMVISAATNVPGLNQSQSFAPSGAINTPASTTVNWSTYTAVPRWSSTSLAFGSVTTGNSAGQSLTLTNDGNTAYNWASNSSIANAPGGFSFNTGACTSVAAGGSCTVTVIFTPTAATSYGGSGLTMAAASYSTNTFAVSGMGITPPSITASAGTLSASTVAPTVATGTVSFTNSGQTPTTLTLAVSGGSSLSATTLSCPASGSCGSVTVTSPTTAGTYNGTLSMTSSAGGTVASVAVNLAVLTPPVIGSSPSSLTFSVGPGLSQTKTITLSNSGGAAATGLSYTIPSSTSKIGQFDGGAGTCPAAGGSLAVGTSCTYTVTYSGLCSGTTSSAGTRSGSLVVAGSNFTSVTISLTGTTLSGSCN